MDGSVTKIRPTTWDQVAMQYEALARKQFGETEGEENAILLAEGAVSHPQLQAKLHSAKTCW